MALREERLRMSVSVRGGCQPCVTAPLARMISGSGNPQAAWEEEVAQAGSRQGGTRGRLRCVQVRSGELGSCSGFLKPRGIAAGVPRRGRQQVPGSRSSCLQHRAEHGGSGESEGFSRRVGVPGVRRAPRKVWERLADRKANSLAASMEKYLVCFVS